MKTELTFRVLLLIAITSFSFRAIAQDTERQKKYNQSFPVFSTTSIQIVNKYGNIHIIPWEKDSVLFEVTVTILAKNEEKADKVISNIDVSFVYSQYYVIAKTEFRDYKGSIWADISDMATTYISGGNNVEINWNVFLPESNEIRINNKFGNIYTTNHSGKVDISLSNGDLTANKLSGETELKLDFSKSEVSSLSNAKINLSYSEFRTKEATKIDLNSRMSEIELPSLQNLNIDSRRDDIKIPYITFLKGKTISSDIKIEEAGDDIILDMKYGNLNIDESMNLKHLFVTSSYAGINVTLPPQMQGKVFLSYKKTVLNLPTILDTLPKVPVNSDGSIFQIEGFLNSEKTDSPEIKINASYGNITIISR